MSILLGACSPKWHMPKPIEMEQSIYGSYFKVTKIEGSKYIEGEIICMDDNTMTLMTLNNRKNKIISIKKNQIKEGLIEVALSSNKTSQIAMWHMFNLLVPLSHGYYGVFTLPLNILVGSAVSYDAALNPYAIKYPAQITWTQMYKFARFPGGLPEGIKIEDIKIRDYKSIRNKENP